MAVEYIVTDANVGMIFPAEHHYLLSLIRSRGPYQDVHRANWHESRRAIRISSVSIGAARLAASARPRRCAGYSTPCAAMTRSPEITCSPTPQR